MKNRFAAILILLPLLASSQQTWLVDSSATGGNNGLTWADAFTDLQSALTAAAYGDIIWVAEGTYFTTNTADRNISFQLPEGVRMYGGFAGVETSVDERDVNDHPTILSGEIGTPTTQDNAYHVVQIYGGDSLTMIDGFTVTNGKTGDYNDPFPTAFGGGILVVANEDHPLASPVIRNCSLVRNYGYAGAGIACIGDEAFACVPAIENCTFRRNRANWHGGGLFKTGRNTAQNKFCIKDCSFIENYGFEGGGGLAILTPTDTVQLLRCAFTKDSAFLEGGGVYLETQDAPVRYEVVQCNFSSNFGHNGAGGLSHYNIGIGQATEFLVKESTFFLNRTKFAAGGGIYFLCGLNGDAKISIESSLFESNFSLSSGGGMIIERLGGAHTNIKVNRCYFLGNLSGTNGSGSFFLKGSGGLPSVNRTTISNSVFLYNTGAVTTLSGDLGVSNAHVVNCSFFRNGVAPFVKYWTPDFNDSFYMKMQILNSIVWEPQVEGPYRLFYNNDPFNFNVNDYTVEHCMINLGSCSYNGVDPCGEGMIYAQWPNFIDTVGTTLEPLFCFPGQNKGSSTVTDTFDLTQDYQGYPRIVGDTVDIGAYEVQTNCGSSVVEEIPETHQTMWLQVQNPVSSNSSAEAELIVTRAGVYTIELIRLDGIEINRANISLYALTPATFSLSGRQPLSPGVYFLVVRDEAGEHLIQKILVQ
ncbi:MAG: hypothetical protein JNL02_15685 [Saprospiraceae bacterium]|nr:hypothetical protein [Saprospiraceae bacterium]